jgi:hypothetical protein
LLSEQWSDPENPHELEPVAKYDTGGCRLTCLSAVAVASGHNSQDEKNTQEEQDAQEDQSPQESDDDDDDDNEWSGIDLQANGEELSLDNSDSCPSSDSEPN